MDEKHSSLTSRDLGVVQRELSLSGTTPSSIRSGKQHRTDSNSNQTEIYSDNTSRQAESGKTSFSNFVPGIGSGYSPRRKEFRTNNFDFYKPVLRKSNYSDFTDIVLRAKDTEWVKRCRHGRQLNSGLQRGKFGWYHLSAEDVKTCLIWSRSLRDTHFDDVKSGTRRQLSRSTPQKTTAEGLKSKDLEETVRSSVQSKSSKY